MENNVKPHRKLKVWQASMDFVTELYKELQSFPAQESLVLAGNSRERLYRFRAI
jgi:23S rRNA-intervening sequence protein